MKKLTVLLGAAALVWCASASAHARVSPAISVAGQLQLYSLAVPTEKENATTKKIVLTTPSGFAIDSFVASRGWTRTAKGDTVTWTGGSTPTGEDSLFQFLAQASKPGTYTFEVEQTYADGSVVTWNGSESSDDPAPVIAVKSSLGGGSTSRLAFVALVLAALGVVIGVIAVLTKGDRQLT